MATPRRAVCLTLKLEADTRADLANALFNLSVQADRGELTTGVSGGPSAGYIYELIEGDSPTHDEYFAQLRAHLDGMSGNTFAGQGAPGVDIDAAHRKQG